MSHHHHGDRWPPPHEGNANEQAQRSPLLIVVPAYNEEGSVAAVVRRVYESAPPCDVLVIDDGSSDETAVRAREAGAWVVSMPFNLGIGGAVQTGFLFARDHGYQLVAQIDGDGQHDPAILMRLLSKLSSDESLDMVYGSRFLEAERGYRVPLSRRVGIKLFAFSLTRILGQRITDPTSGFRLCNRRAIELFAAEYPQDYPEVEALLMLRSGGFRFAEVAVQMSNRAGGRSSITRLRSGYYMVKVSLALLAGLLRERVKLTGPTLEPQV